MMYQKKAPLALGVLAAAFAATPALAKDTQPWSLTVKAGVEYDSNVTVEQTDVTTNIGDSALNLGVEAGYKLIDNKNGDKLSIAYDFSQSLHQDLTDFDIQSHSGTIAGATEVAGATLGMSYSFYHLLLGGDRFLDMQVLNPSVSGFIAPNVYARGAYSYFDKNFKVANDRDAENHQGAADLYYFFNNSRSYFTVGGRYEIENAVGPEFDYDGFALNANVQFPLVLTSDKGKINLGYAYRKRDYDNVTPSLGEKRHENRSTFKAMAETPLIKALSLRVEYQYTDRNSNYLPSNYTENLVSGTLSYRF